LVEMEAMLPRGSDKHRVSIQTEIGEGTLAQGLENIQNRYQGLSIGSYPWFKPGQYGTAVVVASLNLDNVDAAVDEVLDLIVSLGGTGTKEQTVSGGNTV